VPEGARVADVGTGDGGLASELCATRRAAHCIATERSPALLGRVRVDPSAKHLGGRLELRCGDGLRALRAADRVEVVVLAGMGTRRILAILDDRAASGVGFTRLVLQPQTEASRLRRELARRGFAVVAEHLVRERGRYYAVIAAEPAADPWPRAGRLTLDELLEVGPCLAESGSPLVLEYWRAQAEHWARVGPTARARLRRARRVVAALERVAL
jgi:tRNA (adenine22-N1)-methyltransferase